MAMPFTFTVLLLTISLFRNSISVVNHVNQKTIQPDAQVGGDVKPKEGGGGLLDFTTGIFDLNSHTKKLNDVVNSLWGSFSKGMDYISNPEELLKGNKSAVIENGLNLLSKGGKSKLKLDMLSSMASRKMDHFDSSAEIKKKADQLNEALSDYMSKNTVELPEYLKNPNLINQKYLKLYKERCKEKDCLTFDTVRVVSIPNKVSLKLPRLCQVHYAFELFKQSSGSENNFILDTVLKTNKENSLDYFINVLSRHNLDDSEFLNVNDQALNNFYYRSSLYYKKFVVESEAKSKLDSITKSDTFLEFFVKSDLIEASQLSTYNVDLNLKKDDLTNITTNFKEFLSADSEEFSHLPESFSKLCQQCLEGTFEENKSSDEMMRYLSQEKVEFSDICSDNEECLESLRDYIDRCKSGDCYKLDNVNLTKNIKLKILLPNIHQAKLAMRIYHRAHTSRNNFLMKIINKVFKLDVDKTLRHFVVMLTKHNVKLLCHKNDAEKALNQFLYQSALFFVRFLTVSKLIKFYSFNKITLYLFSIGRYKYLKNLAKSLSFGNKVVLNSENLSSVMNSYRDYLMEWNPNKLKKISNYFGNMCKDVIVKQVSSDKMSSDLFDASSEMKVEEVCGKKGNEDCSTFSKLYLDRCKNGDCYTLDTKVYYTKDKAYKLNLPILYQLDAAIYVFKKSSSYGTYAERLVQSLGHKKEVDPYVQFYKNLVLHNAKVFEYSNFDTEVLNKYLFNSAVYFKFINDNRLLDVDVSQLQEYQDTTYKIENFMKRMLKNLVGVERVKFPGLNLKNLFEVYNKYFNETQSLKNEAGANIFLKSCEKIFGMFKQMQNDDGMFEAYVKNIESDDRDFNTNY